VTITHSIFLLFRNSMGTFWCF